MIGLYATSARHADPGRDVTAGGAADPAILYALPAKIAVPPLPPTHRPRGRLVEMLAAADRRKATTVLGPPGSGKTTLVSHWVRSGQAPGPVAWLTLDEEDDTPRRFWAHVLASLHRHVPGAVPAWPSPQRVDGTVAGWLATALGDRSTPVVLVLDRVELLTDPALARELDLLVAYARSGLHLVACGRSGGVGWLHRHRLAGEVAEIGPADLALRTDEVPGILRAHDVDVSDADLRALHGCTEGWMTGVCLHALALRSGVGPASLPHPLGRQAVTDFLRTEVLDAQPARVRHLLLRTSLLDRVDPELADQLTGRSDARAILGRLAEANSFVVHDDATHFRYREPFRAMLEDALVGSRPDLLGRLHTITARWYAERGCPTTAVAHAVRAGDWALATAIAADRIGVAALLTAPGARSVRDRLAALPEAPGDSAAELVRGVLALAGYDVPRASAALERAGRAAGGTPRRLAALDVAHVALARLTGNIDAAGAAAARYARLPSEDRTDAARTRRFIDSNLGVAHLWAGELAAARAALTRAAAAEPEPGTEFGAHDALGHLGLLSMYEGRTVEAAALAGQAIALAERAGIPPAERVGAASVTLAATALVRNDLAAVRLRAAEALATRGGRSDPPTATTLALIRAWAACARQDGEGAVAAARAARAHLRHTRPPRLFGDRIELTALWAYLIVGDLAEARGCVNRIENRAERTVAEGYLLEAQGDFAAARATLARVPGPDASPSALQYAALALGRLAAATGDVPTATKALGDALDYGRPDRRRRAVSDSGKWAPTLLRGNATLASDHGWLTAREADSAAAVAGELPQPLTDREAQVLRHLSEAVAIRDIAAAMGVSVNTVKTHLKNIYRKLGTTGRSAAARRARELNLLPGTRDPTP